MGETNGVNGHSKNGRSFQTVMEDLSKRILNVRRPADFVAVLIYGVPIYSTIRIGIEAGIFDLLAKAGSSLTAEHIAETIGEAVGDPDPKDIERRDFVVRNLRVLAALGLVDETSPFTYHVNELTLALADPGLNAGISQVYHGVMGPRSTMAQMITYAKERGWKAPDTALDGPYQRAHEIKGMSTFEHWVKCDPEQMSRLNASMQGMQANFTHWMEWFPKEALFGSGERTPETFLVDVGGGYGHDISALAATYPDEPIRMVLQDLPGVLEEGEERRKQAGQVLDSRIQRQPHDFFSEQPVKGAEVYYMHKILHDWPDKDCIIILERIRDALAPGSRILVNDCILLNQGCPLR
ncbi:hypothetical protein M409DRAFT_38132 [Zasmidium cellare ATCC 36951]|uniref:Uncharacterized protein n=1 Tax=Zasmidium cellare ATCC 36951 TaxID=1080233 RepID=A0A6A6BVX6_ZASCE|nr:uncharacterized protein M409DRAFT_38132 [Zasmidium cellare ATCC 36951]KAF2158703.1 hypothetical protein M409DRAFT_38132 [Zasmidium cellare ATCC 36951]